MTRDANEVSPAVELTGVARRFGARWALRGIDLRVEPGSVVALRGRNGSGKTTLLRVCATLLRPSRGSASVFGLDVTDDADRVRELVGFLAHRAGLYEDLTAIENLRFAARMMAVRSESVEIQGVLERVGLGAVADERVRGFSSGMQRRLAFARLLLRRPALLLLDEPYASFDAEAVEMVNGFALEVAGNGGAVLIATHDTSRAHGVAEHEVQLEAGRRVDAGRSVASRESRIASHEGSDPTHEARTMNRPPSGARNAEPRAPQATEVDGGADGSGVGSQLATRNPRGARRVAP